MNAPREQLPPLPARIARLPVDARGYPVPYFVAWVDGRPDHRMIDEKKIRPALKLGLCWICGQALGAFKGFAVGPMCAITRTVSEPPSHRECLEFAARACPFLTRPLAHRRLANLPADRKDAPGLGLDRNPGCLGVWMTRSFETFGAWRGNAGTLYSIGAPSSIDWYAQGRPATRAEVNESIASGLPALRELARDQDRQEPGAGAVRELERQIARVWALLPPG